MKNFCSAISIIICMAMLISITAVVGYASDAKTYYIKSIDDLKAMTELINNNEQGFAGATLELTADIKLNGGEFTVGENGEPLYNGEATDKSELLTFEPISDFKGTFNGNNHVISGIYCKGRGIFEKASGAVIKNVIIKNSLFDTRSQASEMVGSVCGEAINSEISGCKSFATVLSSADKVGGIVGYAENSVIDNCRNIGYVLGKSCVGGVVGELASTEKLTSCLNKGTVAATGDYAGGIVSKIGTETTVDCCANAGSVSSESNYVGGIAGEILLDKNTMSNCYNSGSVSGKDNVGGMAGSLYISGDNHDSEIAEFIEMKRELDRIYGDGIHIGVWPPPGFDDERYSELYEIIYSDLPRMISCYSNGNVSAQEKTVGSFSGKFDGNIWSFRNCWFNSVGKMDASADQSIMDIYWDFSLMGIGYDGKTYFDMKIGLEYGSEEVMKTESFAEAMSSENVTFVVDKGSENNGYVMLKDFHDADVHIHSYSFEIIKAATCEESGEKIYTCGCGDSYSEVIPALGHNTVKVSSTSATCEKGGTSTYKCTRCGYSYITSDSPKKAHDYTSEIVASATCTRDGKKVFTCKNCNYSYEQIIRAKGHRWDGWGYIVYPTAISEGEMARTCQVCNVTEKRVASRVVNDSCIIKGNTLTGLKTGMTVASFKDEMLSGSGHVTITAENSGNDTIGTGSKIKMSYPDNTSDEFEVIIYGDVNGDGWYDGQDATTVNMLANGMLSREQVSDAAYMAADCNHDGVINQLDVDILNRAGVLLSDIDQTKSTDELLETSAAYAEYTKLVSQNVSPDIPKTEEPPTQSKNIFERIIDFIISLINKLISIFR